MKGINAIKKIVSSPWQFIDTIIELYGSWLPDDIYLKIRFRARIGKWLNLKNPKSFNEKLQWLKLYNRKPQYTNMVDKYAVKDYVASKIGEEFIIPTLGVWDTPDQIEWDRLPKQFVLKTTHGGGGCGVIVCKDKSNFDIVAANNILRRSLESDIYRTFREWPYKNVRKRIIAEKYMTDNEHENEPEQLKDYKFFCFNGKMCCFKIDFDRFTNHKANYYNREADLLPFGEQICIPDYTRKIDKPENFDRMIEIVEILSQDIPFLRVDLYNIRGKIYFGELTFFPAAGMGKFTSDEWDMTLGSWIDLK